MSALPPFTPDYVPSRADIATMPLDHLGRLDRFIVRQVAQIAQARTAGISGLEYVLGDRDPFVLVLNHSTKLEAVLLPALLMLLRGGRHVHFLADWNFLLIPGVGLLYRCAQVIVVPNKSAKPRFLNALRPVLTTRVPPMEQARGWLAAGHPVGVFPEGTVNRDPRRLLPGRLGAARLSLESGVPVVPAGISFPGVAEGEAIPEGSAMHIAFGPPMRPPVLSARAEASFVRGWHADIMSAVGELSHKTSTSGIGDDHEGLQHYPQQAR